MKGETSLSCLNGKVVDKAEFDNVILDGKKILNKDNLHTYVISNQSSTRQQNHLYLFSEGSNTQ